MNLNKLGIIADSSWKNIVRHYPIAELDYYVIMPNHIHGILIIDSKHPNEVKQIIAD